MKEGKNVYFKNEYTGVESYQYIKPQHLKEIKVGCKIRSSLLEGCYGYGNVSANDCRVTAIMPADITIIKEGKNKIQTIEISNRTIKVLTCKDFYKYHPFIEYMKNSTVIISGEFPEVESWLLSQDIEFEKI